MKQTFSSQFSWPAFSSSKTGERTVRVTLEWTFAWQTRNRDKSLPKMSGGFWNGGALPSFLNVYPPRRSLFFQLLFAPDDTVKLLCVLCLIRTLSFPSLLYVSSMKLLARGIQPALILCALADSKLSDVERHPGDYRTLSPTLPPPPFSTPLPLFLLPIPLLFAFVGIIPCYIHTLALALSCLSKTVTQSTMSVSVFSISSLLWSNITVDMVDWYQPNLSVSICVPSNMVHNLTQTWGEMLLFSIVQSRRWRRTWATPNNKQYKTFSCQFAFYANVIEAFRMLPYKKWKA